jgi:hypothetical protein
MKGTSDELAVKAKTLLRISPHCGCGLATTTVMFEEHGTANYTTSTYCEVCGDRAGTRVTRRRCACSSRDAHRNEPTWGSRHINLST